MNSAARSALDPAPIAASVLVGSSLLSVVLMLHHPSVGMRDTRAAITAIASIGWLARVVHGGLIVLMAAQALAYVELSDRLGWSRRVVRAALAAYGAGFIAMIGAALVSGFVVPKIGDAYAATAGDVEPLRPVLVACTAGNRVLADFGAVAMALAVALWSWAMRDRSKVIAALGLAAGAAPIAAILTGALRLEVGGMTLVTGLFAAWNVVVGAALFRRAI
jgi:hypothetical protein